MSTSASSLSKSTEHVEHLELTHSAPSESEQASEILLKSNPNNPPPPPSQPIDVVEPAYTAYTRPRSWKFTSKRFIFANLLCFVLVFWTFSLAFTNIYIGGLAGFSSTKRTVYTTCIAVLASCITLYLASHIRLDWLKTIDLQLPRECSAEELAALDRTWRTALGISSPQERWREKKTWPMQLSLAFAALMTAAIVASMTPTTSTVQNTYQLNLPAGHGTDCAFFSDWSLPAFQDFSNNVSTSTFAWKKNATSIFAVVSEIGCPAIAATLASGDMNGVSPKNYSYNIQGTAVHYSAIGAHESLVTYTSPSENLTTPLQNITDSLDAAAAGQGANLAKMTQCLPVLAANPVRCRRNADVRVDGRHALVAALGACNRTHTFAEDLTYNYTDAAAAFACLDDARIGTGSLVLSATNSNALLLALAIADRAWVDASLPPGNPVLPDNAPPLVYSAVCDFDLPRAIAWKAATVDLRYTANSRVPFSRMVYANASCAPLADLGPFYAAHAAAGLLPVLAANRSAGGWAEPLRPHLAAQSGVAFDADSGVRVGPFAFDASTGPLEDVLGLMAGIAMSNIPLTQAALAIEGAAAVPTFPQDALYFVEVVRIGAGKPWAVVFSIPPILAWFFVIYLRLKVAHGRPLYFSSHMTSLVSLGRYRDGV